MCILKYKAIVFILIVLLAYSCDKVKNDNPNDSKKVIIATLGTVLNLPSDIEEYSPFSNTESSVTKAKYKIYTALDAECGKCISQIELWSDFNNEIKKTDVELILYMHTTYNFKSFKAICEDCLIPSFSYPFYLDINRNYLKKNPFMSHSHEFETVLTDGNNRILLIGNPLHSSKTRKLYMSVINGKLDINKIIEND